MPNGIATVSVLIADPDRVIGQLVKNALRALGFRKVFLVECGQEALDIMRETPIDIIISEWDMSPVDGMELCEYLRTNPATPNRRIPFVLVTARSAVDDVTYARDCGITEYLAKPFSIKALCDRIVAIVEKPRDFVVAPEFKGPDRRRRSSVHFGEKDRRKRAKNVVKVRPPSAS